MFENYKVEIFDKLMVMLLSVESMLEFVLGNNAYEDPYVDILCIFK
jgi:hypothetical protein